MLTNHTDFVVVPSPVVACSSSLFENLHNLRTEASHCQDIDHLYIVYFNRTYENDAAKLDLSLAPRANL